MELVIWGSHLAAKNGDGEQRRQADGQPRQQLRLFGFRRTGHPGSAQGKHHQKTVTKSHQKAYPGENAAPKIALVWNDFLDDLGSRHTRPEGESLWIGERDMFEPGHAGETENQGHGHPDGEPHQGKHSGPAGCLSLQQPFPEHDHQEKAWNGNIQVTEPV